MKIVLRNLSEKNRRRMRSLWRIFNKIPSGKWLNLWSGFNSSNMTEEIVKKKLAEKDLGISTTSGRKSSVYLCLSTDEFLWKAKKWKSELLDGSPPLVYCLVFSLTERLWMRLYDVPPAFLYHHRIRAIKPVQQSLHITSESAYTSSDPSYF